MPLDGIAQLRISLARTGSTRRAGTRVVFDLELVPVSGRAKTLIQHHEREPLVLARLIERCLRGHSWKGSLVR